VIVLGNLMIQAYSSSVRNDQLIARWLITCAVVIFGMILLGGVTRL